jgi:hypothetical protein
MHLARSLHGATHDRHTLEQSTMSHRSRIAKASDNEIPAEIAELVNTVSQLPAQLRSHLQPTLDRVVESTRRRRRILNVVQDALSQLRLDMKYLMFDLEATRRERDDYRRQLDEA